MKRINTLLVVTTFLAISLGAFAHEGTDHKKTGPVIKEQKEWGIAGDAKAVKRTIELVMGDNMRFTPDHVEVKEGDVVKLVITNAGQMFHEMVIGTKAELDEHAALMVKFPTMEHDAPYMAHVKPGTKNEIIWNFNRAGDFDFACLVAGHYQAGMVGKITVTGASKSSTENAVQSAPITVSANAATTAQAPSTQDMSDGEVRKIDKDSKKITLKHGEIKNLDMPPMTMVFQVKDEALLGKVKSGDKVRFTAEKIGGALVVTDIQPTQ